jgi:hypothetical protein
MSKKADSLFDWEGIRELVQVARAMSRAQVFVSNSNEDKSRFMLSEENAVLHFTRSDIMDALGSSFATRNITPIGATAGEQLPGDIIYPSSGPGTIGGTTIGGIRITPGGGGGFKNSPISIINPIGGWNLLGGPSVTIGCQAKAGTATLVGFNEFGSPSIPPRKYCKKQFTGRRDRCNFDTQAKCNAGTPIAGSDAKTHGLTCQYSHSTGVLTTSGANVNYQDTTAVCPSTTFLSSDSNCADTLNPSNQFWIWTSPTLMTENVIGQCLLQGVVYSQVSTTLKIALSDEDTDDMALQRALGGASYAPGACSTYMGVRGPGQYSFNFSYAQVSATLTGCQILQGYLVTFNLGQRIVGSGAPFTPSGTIEFSFGATSTTETVPWQDITTQSGYETALLSVTVSLT